MSGESEFPREAPTTADDLLEHAPCGFLSFGDDGVVERVNATLLDMLGYEGAEVTGRHVENILSIGTRIFYQTHWFPMLRLHGSAEEIFLMLRSNTSEEIGVLANAVRRERRGRAVYDCIVIRVRERQKYEDELLSARRAAEQARSELEAAHDELVSRAAELERLRAVADDANRAKSAFLAVMSHELRTPLNAIAGYVDIMEMGIHGPVTDAQRKDLARIKVGQRHLLGLIDDILNLSRIESGRVEYLLEEIDLAEIVPEVAPMLEPLLAAKRLAFEVVVPPDQIVRADREKVQQILINLLANAVKFTPDGGQIAVEAARREGAAETVVVAVRDTGVGIPAEKLNSIFEPFVQVDARHASAREGTGLGLAISRNLARGMGGDLTAQSVEGRGSAFILSLPAARRG